MVIKLHPVYIYEDTLVCTPLDFSLFHLVLSAFDHIVVKDNCIQPICLCNPKMFSHISVTMLPNLFLIFFEFTLLFL